MLAAENRPASEVQPTSSPVTISLTRRKSLCATDDSLRPASHPVRQSVPRACWELVFKVEMGSGEANTSEGMKKRARLVQSYDRSKLTMGVRAVFRVFCRIYFELIGRYSSV